MYWAKSGSATAQDKLIVRFGTKYTDPRGKLCAKDKTDPNYGDKTKCDDDFAVSDTLTTEWKQYTHPFSDFMQEDWGLHPMDGLFPAKDVYAIKFAQAPGRHLPRRRRVHEVRPHAVPIERCSVERLSIVVPL